VQYWEFPAKDVQVQWREARIHAGGVVVTCRAVPPVWCPHARVCACGTVHEFRFNDGTVFHASSVVSDGDTESTDQHFPDFFYDGVVYGVSTWNPNAAVESAEVLPENRNEELLKELLDVWPKPSSVIARRSRSRDGSWEEVGYAVRFDEPSVEAERAVLFLARAFGQVRPS
jgi:hypothetical protein